MIYKGYAQCKTEKNRNSESSKKRNIYILKKIPFSMDKRGQLGVIEFKFFFYGIIFGIVLALVLVFLGTAKVLPFQIPLVCG